MYEFTCEVEDCGFTSTGWETEELAEERELQHMAEHESGEAMPELAEFIEGRS